MKRPLALCLACFFLLIALSCASESPKPESQGNQSSKVANVSPPQAKSDSIFARVDNQMSIAELRARLEELKAIEREARKMVNLRRRQNWMLGVSECMRIMERLKPREEAISNEYQRMLSPAGINIASAAMNLISCTTCIEDDADDCRDARNLINKADRELKREMRQR